MAYTSGFFDANEIGEGVYDRVYSAADFAHYFSLLVGSGVFYLPTGGLKVTAEASPAMSVVVNPGNGWIEGYYITVPKNEEEHLVISVADALYSRIDSIIMGLTLDDRRVKLYVRSGTASSFPSPVDLIRNGSVQEYELAQILIEPGISSITNTNITDMRADSSRCGFVRSLVEKETGYLENFVQKSDKGKPNGVASLDSSGKVPNEQLPSMDYIPTSQKGTANGVASTDKYNRLNPIHYPITYTYSAKTINLQHVASSVTYHTAQFMGRVFFIWLSFSRPVPNQYEEFTISDGIPTVALTMSNPNLPMTFIVHSSSNGRPLIGGACSAQISAQSSTRANMRVTVNTKSVEGFTAVSNFGANAYLCYLCYNMP